jgi:hypothetical protein
MIFYYERFDLFPPHRCLYSVCIVATLFVCMDAV